MCEVLQISRSTYYYEAKQRDHQEEELTQLIVQVFKASHNIYGQRKIKVELQKLGWQVSRRRISRIMKEQGLLSKYGMVTIKEAKDAGFSMPITKDHWLYIYMRDNDGDGMVGE